MSRSQSADGCSADQREAARERQSHVRHELRAPLAVMYPLLSLLLDEATGPLTATQREYLEILERNIARMNCLVASAAESGWLDCAGVPSAAATVALRDVAEEVVSRLETGAGAPDVVVVAPSGPVVAWADREDVRCVVHDLVDNAVRYASGGAVTIEVRRAEDAAAAVVAVHDEGRGMSAEDVAQAFGFGFRGEAARESGAPGLGVGLWTCRRLAERNGGAVELRSTQGQGTVVTVTLPGPAG